MCMYEHSDTLLDRWGLHTDIFIRKIKGEILNINSFLGTLISEHIFNSCLYISMCILLFTNIRF